MHGLVGIDVEVSGEMDGMGLDIAHNGVRSDDNDVEVREQGE